VRVTDDPVQASRILDLAPSIPARVWGRDEGHTGDMWNSNSVVSWLLASAGLDPDGLQPPSGGRAPGWRAGLEIAAAMRRAPILDRAGRRCSLRSLDLRTEAFGHPSLLSGPKSTLPRPRLRGAARLPTVAARQATAGTASARSPGDASSGPSGL
jgi:hypothetical protein